jgi:hypothetical protein
LRSRLRGLKGRVCFQWVPAHCGLFGNEKANEEARKAADLGPDDSAQRGRISFEVVKGLIQSKVNDRPPSPARTSQVYGDGPFRHLQGASRRKEVLLYLGVVAPYYWGKPGKRSKERTLRAQVAGTRRRIWSTS